MKMTGGRGVDTAIEAVGVPASFATCEEIVAPGGTIANIGVHGSKVDLHLERLWSRNITITTRLVDTVTMPMLLKTLQSGKINPKLLLSLTDSSLPTSKCFYGTHSGGRQPPKRSRLSSKPETEMWVEHK